MARARCHVLGATCSVPRRPVPLLGAASAGATLAEAPDVMRLLGSRSRSRGLSLTASARTNPSVRSMCGRAATLRHMSERMSVEKRAMQRDANNMRHAMSRFSAEMKRLEIYTEVRRDET